MGTASTARGTQLRLARATELPRLQEIEVAAGEPFRTLGMHAVADDDPPAVDDLMTFVDDARCWVAVDAADRPVGYLLVDEVDGTGHIEQVSVHPDFARRGIGAALIDRTEAWAADRSIARLTLTTYAAVPWNAPYYHRLGFRVVDPADWGAGIASIRAAEGEQGLDRWPRVVMARNTGSRPSANGVRSGS